MFGQDVLLAKMANHILKFSFKDASSEFKLFFQNYGRWKIKVLSVTEYNVFNNVANQIRYIR